jgi:hypothetical protein
MNVGVPHLDGDGLDGLTNAFRHFDEKDVTALDRRGSMV